MKLDQQKNFLVGSKGSYREGAAVTAILLFVSYLVFWIGIETSVLWALPVGFIILGPALGLLAAVWGAVSTEGLLWSVLYAFAVISGGLLNGLFAHVGPEPTMLDRIYVSLTLGTAVAVAVGIVGYVLVIGITTIGNRHMK